MIVLADFVTDVMRELVVALGGALFVGNLLALIRRRATPAAVHDDIAGDDAGNSDNAAAPVPIGRTVVFLLLGFVVMVWGIASLAVS